MASIVSAGTTTATALNMSADTTGILQLASNNGTVAVTVGTDQSVTMVGNLSVTGTTTNTGYISAPNTFGFKNRIINGGMVIDQRNSGAAVTPTNSQYLVDRWQASLTQASKYTAQQNAASVTPPAGYKNYLGFTSSSAYSVAAGDIFGFGQIIEGFNVADLGWGTANAQTITISFWVRSSLTGAFGGAVKNDGDTRNYPFTFTISSANTWEQKTVTIAGDTSGTWLTTNGAGINIRFSLGCGTTYSGTAGAWTGTNTWQPTGSTSVVGTSGATFYITGVQLEKGSTATSFDFRDYGTELMLCQRYYERRTVGSQNNERLATTGMSTGSTSAQIAIQMLVQKRSAPALNVGNLSNTATYNGVGNGTPTSYNLDNAGVFIVNIGLSGLTAGLAIGGAIQWCWGNSSPTPYIEFSSEL